MSLYLDQLYFEWLYSQISSVKRKNPSHTYWKLFKILYTKEFVWIVPNDDNRVEDGKDLRYVFLGENNLNFRTIDQEWLNMGCSFLELLIILSKITAFLMSTDHEEWFWDILENIDLRQYNDRAYIPRNEVEDKLDKVIWRTYKPNGHGGLFPLKQAQRDQREVELWYQLNAYVGERA